MALPTAICTPSATAVLWIAISGTAAPAMPASWTGRTLPSVLASRKTGCWPSLLAAVYPTATMVPAEATVAPTTDSAAALPSRPVGSQVVPVPVLV